MQFHLNGFEPGDPEISDPDERYPTSEAQVLSLMRSMC